MDTRDRNVGAERIAQSGQIGKADPRVDGLAVAEPTAAQREVIDLDWATTVAEDFGLMESVQHNMSSRGYVPGPLMIDESGTGDVHHENAVPHLQRLAVGALGDAG